MLDIGSTILRHHNAGEGDGARIRQPAGTERDEVARERRRNRRHGAPHDITMHPLVEDRRAFACQPRKVMMLGLMVLSSAARLGSTTPSAVVSDPCGEPQLFLRREWPARHSLQVGVHPFWFAHRYEYVVNHGL